MGSKTATQARNAQRQADTAELMSNIMTGGEISKKREAELAAAADRGRGIKFIEGSPTVKGLTQIDPVTGEKKPVFRTGATAADYTGRIVSQSRSGVPGLDVGKVKTCLSAVPPKRALLASPKSSPKVGALETILPV